jgi:alpha-L-fucosidase 2
MPTARDEQLAPASRLTLWYRQPAARFEEALPIGNGRLGAMVYGAVMQERLSRNEDTLWAGGQYDPANPEALAALAERGAYRILKGASEFFIA